MTFLADTLEKDVDQRRTLYKSHFTTISDAYFLISASALYMQVSFAVAQLEHMSLPSHCGLFLRQLPKSQMILQTD